MAQHGGSDRSNDPGRPVDPGTRRAHGGRVGIRPAEEGPPQPLDGERRVRLLARPRCGGLKHDPLFEPDVLALLPFMPAPMASGRSFRRSSSFPSWQPTASVSLTVRRSPAGESRGRREWRCNSRRLGRLGNDGDTHPWAQPITRRDPMIGGPRGAKAAGNGDDLFLG